jgi:tRNA (guanine37-N1)-methyltransferase
VLGNADSLSVESFEEALLEAPSFTKPKEYEGNEVVSEFLKGNHSKITDLKRGLALCKTKYFRPDLYKKGIANEK